VGGIPEQVRDGITGFLTPPGDAEAMAARIVQLIEDEEFCIRWIIICIEIGRK